MPGPIKPMQRNDLYMKKIKSTKSLTYGQTTVINKT